MRVLLQRCAEASVRVGGEVVGAIDSGLLAFVGTTHDDDEPIARALARKTAACRIFPDAEGRTNLAVGEAGGAVLVVSQFTLYADTRKGNRPSFVRSGDPDRARLLIAAFEDELRGAGLSVASGVFGADMRVELVNDGPFTVLLEKEGG